MYTVYKHTSPSGKVYIGITSQNVIKRWQNGRGYIQNPHFYAAIKKYGWDNIIHEILFTELSEENAKDLEKELIKKYSSGGKCYNLTYGGEGGSLKEESKIKISNALKNPSKETGEKIGKWHRNKKVSDSTRKKISQHNLSRGQEWIKKISNAHKKCVIQLDLLGNVIREWDCALSVKQELGIDNSAIGLCASGKRNTAGGFKWKYKNV